MLGQRKFSRVQLIVLLLIGSLMGAALLSPAIAEVSNKAFKKVKKDNKNDLEACEPGAVYAYAVINGAAVNNGGFAATGIEKQYNCAGGAITADRDGTGNYNVRIPGITTPDASSVAWSVTIDSGGCFFACGANSTYNGTVFGSGSEDFVHVQTANVVVDETETGGDEQGTADGVDTKFTLVAFSKT
jgi:hypothetical protein